MINISKINISIDNLIIIFLIYLILMLFSISGCSPRQSNNKINKNLSNIKVVWSRKTGNMYSQKQDNGPSDPRDIPNLSLVTNVVPKYEPKSRYGNQPKYKVFNKTYKVLASSKGYKASGYASWYGTKFHGFRTSSGEIYDMYKMTAAHKTLPLPTYLKVVNVHNKRSIIVKVNDRGPFHGGRILDLSYAAASKLGIVDNGIGKVEIIAINPARNSNKLKLNTSEIQNQDNQYNIADKYFLESSFQLGAFSVKENATKLANELKILLKNSNLLNNKHYEINIFEHNLKQTTKKNILYKVVISFKGDKLDYKKLKNFLLNLPNNNLAIN